MANFKPILTQLSNELDTLRANVVDYTTAEKAQLAVLEELVSSFVGLCYVRDPKPVALLKAKAQRVAVKARSF